MAVISSKKKFVLHGSKYNYYSVDAAFAEVRSLPASLIVLLENNLRHYDNADELSTIIDAFQEWQVSKTNAVELPYSPSRVLMQDFTGVPSVVDLAAMRDAMEQMGGEPQHINPKCKVDLVIDHSIQVDKSASPAAMHYNAQLEMQRNQERYALLNWAQSAFENFRVVPPGRGICHQVNLEYLANVVWSDQVAGEAVVYPDTVVGTDSHTTMINALGVLGWGVGGIEAEAAILGQSISLKLPDVIGVYLHNTPRLEVLATDIVLAITERLRHYGVVNKFVEFFGPGLQHLSLADRATIANMAPEYGSTCGFFPIDEETLAYLKLTGRDAEHIDLIAHYAKCQGLWHNPDRPKSDFTDCIEVDLASLGWAVAGPHRPQDRVDLGGLKTTVEKNLVDAGVDDSLANSVAVSGLDVRMKHADVVIAAITSCTNTSNPEILIAAGLLAKNALELGLQVKPWVKTSFAPGSRVVQRYLEELGLIEPLEQLGFHIVGFGCTTCIGNSGPLADNITQAVEKNNLYVSSVLSGNRNFAGRIHPQVQANWLASPPLVVAFALAGTTKIDLIADSLGQDRSGKDVMLVDIWPKSELIQQAVSRVNGEMFLQEYAGSFWQGAEVWQQLSAELSLDQKDSGVNFSWNDRSTYVRCPDFFNNISADPIAHKNIDDAAVLAVFGDSVTTDHISPAGNIAATSPAGKYLLSHDVSLAEFNSYGARRGNHEVMLRGTFANVRIRNLLLDGVEGGYTFSSCGKEIVSIYDSAMQYKLQSRPIVVFAGKEYGSGSSRDWAAKGTLLLGVECVFAESFERIHRSNLIGMGVLPCKLPVSVHDLSLIGDERISLLGIESMQETNAKLELVIKRKDGLVTKLPVTSCIDTDQELSYYKNNGVLNYMLRKFFQEKAACA